MIKEILISGWLGSDMTQRLIGSYIFSNLIQQKFLQYHVVTYVGIDSVDALADYSATVCRS